MMKALRFPGNRLLALLTAIPLVLLALPLVSAPSAVALTDAYSNNAWKVNPSSGSETTIYTGLDYLLCAPDDVAANGAMTAKTSAPDQFPAVAATIDADGTYYTFSESKTAFLRWRFSTTPDGNACYLRPSGDVSQYLGLDGTSCCLTKDATQALAFSFHRPDEASKRVALYAATEAGYLVWDGKALSLAEDGTAFSFQTLSPSHEAYFYAVNSGTQATLVQQATAWEGDTITLPPIPERSNATPVQWNQIDPTNNNEVLGSFPAGSTFGPMTAATYFLAEYAMDTASIAIIGNGTAQTMTAKMGQIVSINVSAKTGYDYTLYDAKGVKKAIQKTDNGDETTQLQFMVTTAAMYLTVSTTCSDFPESDATFIRICNAEDLRLFANLVNATKEPQAFDAVLTQNIDLAMVCSITKGSWVPIGAAREGAIGATAIRFAGTGHTISRLYTVETTDVQGLFGAVESLTVSNLTIDGQIQGGNQVGGLVASCDTLTVTNCASLVTVSGTEMVGGFCGKVTKTATFVDSFAACAVQGTAMVGLMFGTAGTVQVTNGFLYGTADGLNNKTPLGTANSITTKHLLALDTLTTAAMDATLQTATEAKAFQDGTVLTALRENSDSAVWMQGTDYPIFGAGSYSIFAAATSTGGTIHFDKTSYVTGTLVTFTVKPDEGFDVIVTGVTVTNKVVVPITMPEESPETYQFYMPADDLSIMIQFMQTFTSTKMGDVNCDQDVNISDVILLNRYISEDKEISITQNGLMLADCDNDDFITSSDSMLIMKLIAKLIVVV